MSADWKRPAATCACQALGSSSGAVAAVSASKRRALLVAEAMHEGSEANLAAVRQGLADGLAAAGAMPA